VTPRVRTIAAVVAAVVLAAVAYVAGVITPALRAPGDNSAEAGFARDMSVHHGQAVHMSLVLIAAPALTGDQRTVDASTEIRSIALDIATSQQEQIGEMSAWLRDWHLSPNGSQPRMAWMPDGPTELRDGLMPGMASSAELDELDTLKGKAKYVGFCQLMLRHHLGGVHMVEGVLNLSHDQEVRRLAAAMLAGQQREINALQTLLATLGAQPLPA
jgi:uncharacterized protein (DUF305 family)